MNAFRFLGPALITLGLAIPRMAAAAPKTFAGENYSITFTETGWDTAMSSSILAKLGGFGGMATLGAQASPDLPNLDSLTTAFSDSLGGEIEKDSSGVKTLGKYQVHWQKFTYDSLPKLSALVSKAAGFKINLTDGSFRVYYLNSDGYAFTIAAMSIMPHMDGPYADVENAIPSLKLGILAGIRDVARSASERLWIRGGRLGGSWLAAHRPVSVEGFDASGSRIGAARPSADGTWALPAFDGALFVQVRSADGSALHLIARP